MDEGNHGDLFNKYQDKINEVEDRATEKFDQRILTLSSSALGLSITFLSQHHLPCPFNIFLYVSWGCFIFTITLTLISYFLIKAGLDLHLERYRDHIYKNSSYPEIKHNPFYNALNIINYFVASIFILGLIFSAISIGPNANAGEKDSSLKKCEKSAVQKCAVPEPFYDSQPSKQKNEIDPNYIPRPPKKDPKLNTGDTNE